MSQIPLPPLTPPPLRGGDHPCAGTFAGELVALINARTRAGLVGADDVLSALLSVYRTAALACPRVLAYATVIAAGTAADLGLHLGTDADRDDHDIDVPDEPPPRRDHPPIH